MKFHVFLIACLVVSVTTAGELDPQQQAWYEKYKTQENAPKPEEMLLNADVEPDLTNGFSELFNGTDLKGWTPKGGTCTFEVKDQQIVGTCVKGSNSTYLCTDREDYADFIFTCDMKWVEDGNTGVMFRSLSKPKLSKPKRDADPNDPSSLTVYGPQFEMEGFSKDRHWSGGIYGQSCGGYFYPLWLKEHSQARAALKEGQWNRVTISAVGNVMKTWINGVPAAHWIDDGTYPKGAFGLQIHRGAAGTVIWKKLRVMELN